MQLVLPILVKCWAISAQKLGRSGLTAMLARRLRIG